MNTERLEKIAAPLLAWFADNARVLPWRERPLPYYVWVSEIMLQQTRVEAVKPFFARFTTALPDVAALAECPEEKLLKLWEGLGYYNRVRNMQKAAQIVMEKYGGRLPDTYEELLSLPGIGSYTAGAIASIAYGQAVPAVDGNVLRVVSRISGNTEDIMKQSVKKQVEDCLRPLMPKEQPGVFNQALMELGATVCLPNGAPACEACPVSFACFAREKGCQTELPVRAAKKARRLEKRTVLVIRDSEHALIRRRPKRGLLAGLYELPNLEGHLDQEEALDYVRACGFSPIRVTPLPPAKHIFSHIEWQMTGYMVLVEDAEGLPGQSGTALFIEPWRTQQEYPIPAAFAAYAEYLSIRLGQEKYKET
ncbi:MAG: A/G-specific adenine glycosylase [Lachnospiraceae bacterium]|nr:A/G-specific adenine glycosylase [Lachnospiraceae bacterium]